jgi:hypothetical protein
MRATSVEELWRPALSPPRIFDVAQIASLPEPARRYLEHAIVPGTPLAAAVRLRMHGEIKLKEWIPFTAEEVLSRERGLIWSARTRFRGISIRGSDRFVDGEGAMRWKAFGILPVLSACGPDVSRSAAGRAAAEAVWLPSVLADADVSWSAPARDRALARFTVRGHPNELALSLGEEGDLRAIKLARWGNPEGAAFHEVDFGGTVEEERVFGGYRIPTRMRLGWYFETPRFESEGEFFRVRVDEARYR